MILDFLPKYPNMTDSKFPVLNPYEDTFEYSISNKQEFYSNRLEESEPFPKQKGVLLKHQEIIARYLSSHTPYNGILLFHALGSGKTCSAVGAIEQIRLEKSSINKAIIIAPSDKLLENFKNELIYKCTAGNYIPEEFNSLTDQEKIHRTNKLVKTFYRFETMIRFAKLIKSSSDEYLVEKYSNSIFVVDEIHNIRIKDEEEKSNLDVYEQIYHLFHIVKNCKIILLSGTPMQDTPEEIATVMNLILPIKENLPTGVAFKEEFMEKTENGYVVKEDKKEFLKRKFRGRVSYIREMLSDITKEYIGEKRYSIGDARLNHFIVAPIEMSKFQSKRYLNVFDTDSFKNFYINARQASLFIYPDGTYGTEGFKKYITIKKTALITNLLNDESSRAEYSLRTELLTVLRGETETETLENISKYSKMYSEMIKLLLNNDKKLFYIYCSLVEGSGLILFSLLLKLFGFTRAQGYEDTPGKRYHIITGAKSTTVDKKIVEKFNSKENMHGEYIQVILGSRASSEGFSFRNIQFEAILTPHFNYSETFQALGRGLRFNSHKDLIENGENPVVQIYQPVAIPLQEKEKSIDFKMYRISEDKDVAIQSIIRLMIESSFDCYLFKKRNQLKNLKDGSRECQYAKCNYSCEGISSDSQIKGTDKNTFDLFYQDGINPIVDTIDSLLRRNTSIKTSILISKLEQQFPKEQVAIVLDYYIDKPEISYKSFLRDYKISFEKEILNLISDIFKTGFKFSFQEIQTFIKRDITEFELLSVLNKIIFENILLRNAYGFECYLRECNNVFYLVNDINCKGGENYSFYTEFLTAKKDINDGEFINDLYIEQLPNIIASICEGKENFEIVQTFPESVQEDLIESAILSERDLPFRQWILETYKAYITYTDDYVYSSFLRKNGITRVVNKAKRKWKDASEDHLQYLKEYKKQMIQDLRKKNPYSIIVRHNPKLDKFCIIDTEKGISTSDTRKINVGKVCSTWKIPELIDIVVNKLAIDPPENFIPSVSNASLANLLSETKFVVGNDEKHNKRLAYWALSNKHGGVRSAVKLCTAIYNKFASEGLLELDETCGVSGESSKRRRERSKSIFFPYTSL